MSICFWRCRFISLFLNQAGSANCKAPVEESFRKQRFHASYARQRAVSVCVNYTGCIRVARCEAWNVGNVMLCCKL